MEASNPYKRGSFAHTMHEIGSGRREFPTSEAKRHHIVPQFLLAKFADPPTKEGRLYQLDRKSGANQRVAVRTAASRHRFYAVESTEAEKDNRIEALLSLLEDAAARAFEKLLENPTEMDEYDRIDIALFLTMQTQRTPAGLARIEDVIQGSAEQVFREKAADPDAFVRDIAEVSHDMTPEEIERGRQELLKAIDEGRLKNRNIRGEAWIQIIDAWLEAAEYPLRVTWLLLHPKEGEFITSDAGFAGVPLPEPGGGSETTFPLAPDACLMLRPGPPGLTDVTISREDVDLINLRTYAWSERYIYGRTQAAVTQVRALAKRKPRRVPARPVARVRQ